MRRPVTVVAAALVLSGCSTVATTPATPATTTPPTAASASPGAAALPPPETLGDVVARLTDPAVPGGDKITLVQNGTATDSGVLDGFAAAMRDGGYLPVTVTARDLRWSDGRPGDVVATITLTGPAPRDGRAPAFSVPMEFSQGPQGWQLTRDTAVSILDFGPSR